MMKHDYNPRPDHAANFPDSIDSGASIEQETFSVRQGFEYFYAQARRARSSDTTRSAPQPSAKYSKPSVVKNGPPAKSKENIRTKILSAIAGYYKSQGKLPKTTWLRDLRTDLQCSRQLVIDELARFRRDLNRGERQTAYINILVNTPNTRRFIDANQRTINTAFRRIRQNLDNAQFALYNSHPNDLALLTLNVPSDTELTFLATCELADRIPVKTVERLLTKKVAASAQYVWRWEIQPENRRRLHLHLLLYVPPDAKKYVTTYPVEQAWFHTLEHLLDEESGCDPLRSEHGADLRGSKHLVHVQYPYKELPEEEQYKFDWGYLATEYKKGKSVLAVRRLYDELPRKLVVPRKHGGVSASLQKLVDDQILYIQFPCFERREADALREELKSLPSLQSYDWELRGSGEFKNIHTTRISKIDFDRVRAELEQFEKSNRLDHPRLTHEKCLELATHILSIKLESNRFLKAHHYSNRRKR